MWEEVWDRLVQEGHSPLLVDGVCMEFLWVSTQLGDLHVDVDTNISELRLSVTEKSNIN